MNAKLQTDEPGTQLFVGDASEAVARVYASLPRDAWPDDAQLSGELVGPYCRYSQTLPARMRFVDRGRGPTLLAEAVVPDPCFWSPDLPFMYSAILRIAAGADCLTAIERPLGIRRLGVHRSSLYVDAKRFVIRGVRVESAEVADLSAAKRAAAALYISDPGDAFLLEASEEGVFLVVELRSSKPTAELGRLGRWPAVAVLVLDGDMAAGKELRLAARNTLLAQRIARADAAKKPAPWAHLLWWEINASEVPTAVPPHDIPIIVYRPDSKNTTIEESRGACDRLQADVASLGDLSGYVC